MAETRETEIPSDADSPSLQDSLGNRPLWPLFLGPVIGIVATLAVAWAVVSWGVPDRYYVDYYPADESMPPTVVIRWPSRQWQLPPIELPRTLSNDNRWKGKQPKRAALRADTILPGGEVLEYDEASPPGRYLIQIMNRQFEVAPDSPWVKNSSKTEN